MEMHQIRYFLAVAEQLNFTRAAEKCNVSQPSLTRAIKNLEDELGGPLFHRERNNTHLTELGRMMEPHLAEVYAQTEAAKSRALDFSKLAQASLGLGVMCTIGPVKLLGLMSGFQRHNTGVDIHIRDARGLVLQEMLLKGDLDVAVFGLPGEMDEHFHLVPLFEERFMIAFAPGHRFEQLSEVRLKDLHGERYLSRANCEFAEYMRDEARRQGVEPIRPYVSERDDWIQAMVMAGLGFTFIPEFAVTVAGLLTRPLVEPAVKRTINLVTVRGRPHSPSVGAFVREATRWRASLAGARKAAE